MTFRYSCPVILLSLLLNACGGTTSPDTSDQLTGTGSSADLTEAPPSVASNQPPTITGIPPSKATPGESYHFTPETTDPDNDTLVYSINTTPAWARFDTTTGTLSGTPESSDAGSSTTGIVISVSDGEAISTLNAFSLFVTALEDEVEVAITSGDASVVSSANLLEDAILTTIESNIALHQNALIQIFNLDADASAKSDGSSLTDIHWNPTHDSALFDNVYGENVALLTTNSSFQDNKESKQKTMAVLGQRDSRYIALAGNPFRNDRRNPDALNEQMHLFLENSLAWLTDRPDLHTKSFDVVLANLDQSYYFPDELAIREWLDSRFPQQATYNDPKACDDTALTACITATTDILIVSQHSDNDGNEQTTADAVAAAMKQGIPVMYLHHDGGLSALGKLLLPLFDTTHTNDNYWHRLGITNFDPTDYLNQAPAEVHAVDTMVRHFRQQSFAIDWAACDEENCRENASLNTQFMDGAGYVQSVMRDLDRRKVDLFSIEERYRLHKLLALLGDHYRTQVSFPMDKINTPDTEFLRSLYADSSQYQYRRNVGSWSDLGNFSRADYSHIIPTTRTVNHISKRNFRSTGAYALPGKTVTVKRNDNSDVAVSVYVNSTRDGSTHLFANDGYKRPRYMQGQAIPIAPHETIRFTSSIGGPIHLSYNTNDLPVEVVISNIGEHAYWSSVSDNESFAAKLNANEFDWAELAAPSFEVHSKTDKMIESMTDSALLENAGVPQALVDAVMRYVHNFPHVLAGFKGPAIDVVEEIHQFAADNNLPVENLDLVKHMNADQATCGYGCSGNPYDAYWSFSPIGHGDIHELGHGLERARFRFSGWPGHAITNFYSYYTKTQYFKTHGVDPNCQGLPFESIFTILQSSVTQADPAAFIKANLWDGDVAWSEGAATIIQMMMSAEDNGALIDGWHLLARLHIIERAYQQAVKDDDKWLATKAGIGMSLYERATAKAMNPEDWLLIAVSHATGFDYRAYFNAWGHQYTPAAAAQVAAFSLPSMPVNYYVSSAEGYCQGQGFDGNKLPLDGSSAWPATGL